MQKILNEIQNATVSSCGSVGITALFVAGLVALWYNKFRSKGRSGFLFWYALISLIVVIGPLYSSFIDRFFADMKTDNVYMWIMPTAPVVLYAGVICATTNVAKKRKVPFYTGLIVVVILAAMTSFKAQSVKASLKTYNISGEQEDVFDYIKTVRDSKDMEHITVWGPEEIMKNARIYDAGFRTIYGADMWEGATESQVCQPYSKWQCMAYIVMHDPATHIPAIAELGYNNNCDIVVMDIHDFEKKDVEVEEVLYGKYILVYENKDYLVYRLVNY